MNEIREGWDPERMPKADEFVTLFNGELKVLAGHAQRSSWAIQCGRFNPGVDEVGVTRRLMKSVRRLEEISRMIRERILADRGDQRRLTSNALKQKAEEIVGEA